MPKILTVELASAQQAEVRRRLAGRDLPPNERRRLEYIRLLGRGLTVPQVAQSEIVHFHSDRGADLHLTARAIRRIEADSPPRLRSGLCRVRHG